MAVVTGLIIIYCVASSCDLTLEYYVQEKLVDLMCSRTFSGVLRCWANYFCCEIQRYPTLGTLRLCLGVFHR